MTYGEAFPNLWRVKADTGTRYRGPSRAVQDTDDMKCNSQTAIKTILGRHVHAEDAKEAGRVRNE